MTGMSQMNFVDIIILIIFFMSMVVGFARGFVSEVISLISVIAAFIVAIMFSDNLAAYFTNTQSVQAVVAQTTSAIGTSTAQPVSYMAIGVAFTLLFVGTLIVGTIAKMIINIPFQFGVLGFSNRILGAVFGLIRGFFLNLVLIFLVQISPLGTEAWWVSSHYVQEYQPAVTWLGSVVSPALANLKVKFNSTLQGVNTSLQGLSGKL